MCIFSVCCLLTYESDIHMAQVQDLKENTQELKLFLELYKHESADSR
jgi:E3 ubiquitin-protein ligase BRE1